MAARVAHLDARFSGQFVSRKVGASSEDAWTCLVCWAVNAVETSSPNACRACKRERCPLWLQLEDAQLELGAHVIYRVNDRAAPAVLVAIDRHRRSLTLAVMTVKDKTFRSLGSDPSIKRHVSFREEVVPVEEIRAKVAPLVAGEGVDASRAALISEYAICRECRGIFHVYPAASTPSDREQLLAKIHPAQLELDALTSRKQELIQSKRFDQVQELSAQISGRRRQLTVSKRGLERLRPLCCPFCGSVVSSEV